MFSLGLVRRALGEDLVRLHRARCRLVDGPHLGPDSPQAVHVGRDRGNPRLVGEQEGVLPVSWVNAFGQLELKEAWRGVGRRCG